MIIKMKTLLAGPMGVWQIGSVQTVTTEEGRALVDGGYAELVSEQEMIQPPAEAETVQAPEAAASRKNPAKSGKRNPKDAGAGGEL